jgi:choline dehydrogenase
MQIAEKIFQTEPLNNVVKSLAKEMNGDETIENEDQFWESYIRKYMITVYHPVGTCKMGKEDDPMAVVTPDTRVKQDNIHGFWFKSNRMLSVQFLFSWSM